jgi:hypothetical protein
MQDLRYDITVQFQHEHPTEILQIPDCVIGYKKDFCYTFVYSPAGDPDVESIVELVRYKEYEVL